ncbi:MAG: hypothetical protein GF411_02920 [Candidatus Lokiarchaeota archaeon]|nr:hypothetical protein [Candidatus Lokiarchaeota archaeon]
MSISTRAEATKKAEALKSRLQGQGWKIRVWENIGWHYSIENTHCNLTVSEFIGKFGVSLSDERGYPGDPAFWHDSDDYRDDPNEAIRVKLQHCREFVDNMDVIVTEASRAFHG